MGRSLEKVVRLTIDRFQNGACGHGQSTHPDSRRHYPLLNASPGPPRHTQLEPGWESPPALIHFFENESLTVDDPTRRPLETSVRPHQLRCRESAGLVVSYLFKRQIGVALASQPPCN